MPVCNKCPLFFILLFFVAAGMLPARSQSISCPPNIDFELGNTSMWEYAIGTCCPVITSTITPAMPNRHVLMSGSGTDLYGGFPVVPPGGGGHALKLGNDSTGAQAERARYCIHVPAGTSNYSLVYRYAVVLYDPAHSPVAQPRFEVNALDSTTGLPVDCAHIIYVSAPGLPGFYVSTVNASVYYRPWSTGMINLSGLGGHTVIVDFASGDCSAGAHFGYGYLDMTCGLFAVNTALCDTSSITLTAPLGFHSYEWYDATFSTVLDTNRIMTTHSPPGTTTYAVILHPDPGFGCTDTLFTTVVPTRLALTPMHDTVACPTWGQALDPHATDLAMPLTYSWTSTGSLPCTTCAAMTVAPPVPTQYIVTVTNINGCSLSDTVNIAPTITASPLTDTVICDTAAVLLAPMATGVFAPLSYSWSPPAGLSCTACPATMARNTATTTYIVAITDASGCTITDTAGVSRAQMATAPMADVMICAGGSIGLTAGISSSVTALAYTWAPAAGLNCGTCPTVTASPAASTTYVLTATSPLGCALTDTIQVTVDMLSLQVPADTVLCHGLPVTLAISSAGISPVYTWWPATGLSCTNCTTAIANHTDPVAYTVTVTDSLGCTESRTVNIDRNTLTLLTMRDSLVCLGEGVQLAHADALDNFPVSYLWYPGGGLSCTDCSTPTATPTKNTTYYVTAEDKTGCRETDSVTLTVELCDIWIPSAFTPNGDGKNDLARVVGHLRFYKDFSFSIFNRFGQVVFHTTDIYAGWDGIFNSVPQDIGVYYYKVNFELNDGPTMLTGDITLIR